MTPTGIRASANGTEPTAARVYRELVATVTAQLKAGDRLPTEPELAAQFEVSRATVREALKALENEGLVYAVQGKGRFVTTAGSFRIERPVTRYESITEVLESLGYDVTNVVLSVTEEEADERMATMLGLEVGDPVIKIVRLRLGDDRPMVFSVNTVPRDVLPGPVAYRDWGGSLSKAIESHGNHIDSSIARISAALLPGDAAQRYNLADIQVWLLIEETCLTRDGRKVLHALDYHRGDELAFNVMRRR